MLVLSGCLYGFCEICACYSSTEFCCRMVVIIYKNVIPSGLVNLINDVHCSYLSRSVFQLLNLLFYTHQIMTEEMEPIAVLKQLFRNNIFTAL